MSWDVFLIKGPRPSADEMGNKNYRPPIMGQADHLKEEISAVLPETRWEGPFEGVYEKDGISLVFFNESDHEIRTIDLEASRGKKTREVIISMCETCGWLAYDMEAGEFIGDDTAVKAEHKDWWKFWKR